MSDLSGKVLGDYRPSGGQPDQLPVPRGITNHTPMRERAHPGAGEVRGTKSAMRNAPETEGVIPPFWPELKKTETGYSFRIRYGVVIEHKTPLGNALKLWNSPDVGDDIYHVIAPESSVFLKYDVTTEGQVDSDFSIIVRAGEGGAEAETTASVHYYPRVGDNTGIIGSWEFKIATLDYDDEERLRWYPFCAGSHIDHYAELPHIINSGNGAGFAKKFDSAGNNYEFKRLDGVYGGFIPPGEELDFPTQINVEGQANEVEVKGNGVWALIEYTTSGSNVDLCRIRDGLVNYSKDDALIADPLEEFRMIIPIPIVSGGGQIQVSAAERLPAEDFKGAIDYTVSGNGNKFILRSQIIGELSKTDHMAWDDGLAVAVPADDTGYTEVLIEIPAGGTGDLPSASQGDMLYYDGTLMEWVPLINPGAPAFGTRNLLQHDGTVPSWFAATEEILETCDGTITVLAV